MKESIRKQISIIVFLMVTVLCLSSTKVAFAAENTTTVGVKGTYQQTDARSMLKIINDFRTGDDAWEWDKDDMDKIYYSGSSKLSELTYDYELEKIAMQRAMEIVVSYSHTRPNGEHCFTALTQKGNRSYGENIAIGTGTISSFPAQKAFTLWAEENEPYSGQGHRRNMLYSDFTAIGVAHVYYNGCHYWVQEFGYDVCDTTPTAANDSEAVVKVEVLNDKIESTKVTPSVTQYELNYGESATLPELSTEIKYSEQIWGLGASASVDYIWESEDNQCVKVENNKIVANKAGSTNIVTIVLGQKVSIPVTVKTISINNANVTLSNSSYTYTGKSQEAKVNSVVVDGKKLQQDKDYTLSFNNNSKPGTATMTVTGIGSCTGTKTVAYTIVCNHSKTKTDVTKATSSKDGKIVKSCTICNKQISTTTISKVSSVTISATSYTYNGKVQKPTVTVKDSKKKTLKNKSDYTVTYSKGSKNVGTYSVTVALKGNYSGSIKKNYTITPAKVVLSKATNAKGKKITLNWKKTDCTSYEIQYSTNSKFKKGVKTIKNISSSKTSYKISNLSKNKTYYVRVRAYNKSLKKYGSWSTSKKVTIKK